MGIDTRYVLETATGGGTSAGSVASVSMPMGGTRKRGDNLLAQEGDKKTVPATTPRNFVAKNAKSSGAGAHKDKKKAAKQGQEKHKKPFMEDHSTATGGWGQGSYDTYTSGRHGRGVAENPEWYSDEANSMSTSQLKSLYKHAIKLRQAVQKMQQQGDTLEPWQQSKVTKAADYLDAVFNAVDDEHDMGEEQGVEEGWDDIKKFGKKAAVAGAIGLGIGAAHAGGWSPSDVPAGGHNQLPDIVAHVKFKVGDKEIDKEINLGSHYRSPGEASKELENFLQSKGIKFYQYSLERVKPKADDKIDSSPATGDMKGGMDTSEPAATGPSTDNYMAKDNDPEHGPSMGGKFVKEGAKVDRQAKHITASMMKKGKSKKDAESIAWAHIKHPKNESADPYFESLQSMVERQLEPNMELDTWIDNFQHADPNKYHQFKNKTPEKKK